MSGDKVLLPPALLTHWVGPNEETTRNDSHSETGNETFDVTRVAAQAARQVYLEGSEPQPETGRNVQTGRRRGTLSDGVPIVWTPSIALPSRSRTINLGDIGRSRVTTRPSPANIKHLTATSGLSTIAEGSRRPSEHVSSEEARTEQHSAQVPAYELSDIPDLENTYVLQSLNDYVFPTADEGQKPQAVFFAEGDTLAVNRQRFSVAPLL